MLAFCALNYPGIFVVSVGRFLHCDVSDRDQMLLQLLVFFSDLSIVTKAGIATDLLPHQRRH